MGRIAEILPQLLNLNCQLEPFEDEKFKDLRFQSPREIILFPQSDYLAPFGEFIYQYFDSSKLLFDVRAN